MGYTKVDNWLWDTVMPQAKPNTFKIVGAVVRQTVGWHKTHAIITFTEFQNLTGIANRGTLCTAIDDAVDCGFIEREADGRSYSYSLKIVPIGADNQSKNRTDNQSKNRTETYTKNRTDKQPSSIIVKEKKETTKPLNAGSGGGGNFSHVLDVYSQNIEAAKPIVENLIIAAAVEHGQNAVIEAIEIAVTAGNKNWRYIDGILNKWKLNGKQNGKVSRSEAESAWQNVMTLAAKSELSQLTGIEREAAAAVGGDKLRGAKPERFKAQFMEAYDAARKNNLQPTG
jgi:DnaD/phage-associated family protein